MNTVGGRCGGARGVGRNNKKEGERKCAVKEAVSGPVSCKEDTLGLRLLSSSQKDAGGGEGEGGAPMI